MSFLWMHVTLKMGKSYFLIIFLKVACGLRTPNEGINQRYLTKYAWAVPKNISFIHCFTIICIMYFLNRAYLPFTEKSRKKEEGTFTISRSREVTEAFYIYFTLRTTFLRHKKRLILLKKIGIVDINWSKIRRSDLF